MGDALLASRVYVDRVVAAYRTVCARTSKQRKMQSKGDKTKMRILGDRIW